MINSYKPAVCPTTEITVDVCVYPTSVAARIDSIDSADIVTHRSDVRTIPRSQISSVYTYQ